MDPDGSSISFSFIALILLVLCNAFFAMSEICIISLNDAKIRKMAQDRENPNRKAELLVTLIDNPSRFLATMQIGITFSGFFASAVAANALARPLANRLLQVPLSPGILHAVSLILITLMISFFSLVLGELVPKRIAMHHCEKIAMALAVPLSFVYKLEKPYVSILSAVTNGILRLIGVDPSHRPGTVTEEEIRMMIDEGNESGSIEASDKDMLNGIFEFDDRTASEMMTHRTEMKAVELGTPLEDIIALAVDTGYSRIPVYEDSVDSIKGILYVKDLLELVRRDPDDIEFNLINYMREPLFVPESTKCKTLLTEFQQQKLQMAVVVDEYGGTSGLVTMEDLLESIVGNIQDEFDDEEDDISQLPDGSYLVDGLTPMEDISKYFGVDIPDEDDFDTIGGYIVNRLGRIPGENERPDILVGNILFVVTDVDERRISKLEALRLPEVLAEGETALEA